MKRREQRKRERAVRKLLKPYRRHIKKSGKPFFGIVPEGTREAVRRDEQHARDLLASVVRRARAVGCLQDLPPGASVEQVLEEIGLIEVEDTVYQALEAAYAALEEEA